MSLSDVDDAISRATDHVRTHGMEFADSVSSIDAMWSALSDNNVTPIDARTELLPTFLAAVGRVADAIGLAQGYLAKGLVEDADDYAELVTRLRSWVANRTE